MQQLWGALAAGPDTGHLTTGALLVRLSTGAVFLAFGAAKFTDHAAEVRSFHTYGLPSPEALVYAVGVLEVVGGALLVLGLLVRLASLALAGDMVGAIVTSGIGQGETVSLTLAPAMLAGMVFLLWAGPGRLALDRRLRGADPL